MFTSYTFTGRKRGKVPYSNNIFSFISLLVIITTADLVNIIQICIKYNSDGKPKAYGLHVAHKCFSYGPQKFQFPLLPFGRKQQNRCFKFSFMFNLCKPCCSKSQQNFFGRHYHICFLKIADCAQNNSRKKVLLDIKSLPKPSIPIAIVCL